MVDLYYTLISKQKSIRFMMVQAFIWIQYQFTMEYFVEDMIIGINIMWLKVIIQVMIYYRKLMQLLCLVIEYLCMININGLRMLN